MSLTPIKCENQDIDVKSEFWSKVERIYGDIPPFIRLVLEYNGFDTFLALKGINWEDKKEFFDGIEESVRNLQDEDEDDELRLAFENALKSNYQRIKNFKLKVGHKSLIINLCTELQNINVEEFNGKPNLTYEQHNTIFNREFTSKSNEERKSPKNKQIQHPLLEELREDPLKSKFSPNSSPTKQSDELLQQVASPAAEFHEALELNDDNEEMVQYIYETEDEDEPIQFTDQEQEYLDLQENYDQDGEVVEMVFEEVQQDEAEHEENSLYMSEEIIKSEANQYENSAKMCDMTEDYRKLEKSAPSKMKRPRHMYSNDFLAVHSKGGRIGTPGRRRPKLQKIYPDTDDGLLIRWADLIRQSCQVIIPAPLLIQYDLSYIEITKIQDFTWEVTCPLCTKKVKLQLTHEGKYVNYKRSNFERHLRIVHYRQIQMSLSKSKENNQNNMKIVKVESQGQELCNQKDTEDTDSSFGYE